MINELVIVSKSDVNLAGFLDEARECAHVYLLAKKTYKGFESMGEIETLREALKTAVDKMIRYCMGNGIMSGSCDYEPDSAARELILIDGK